MTHVAIDHSGALAIPDGGVMTVRYGRDPLSKMAQTTHAVLYGGAPVSLPHMCGAFMLAFDIVASALDAAGSDISRHFQTGDIDRNTGLPGKLQESGDDAIHTRYADRTVVYQTAIDRVKALDGVEPFTFRVARYTRAVAVADLYVESAVKAVAKANADNERAAKIAALDTEDADAAADAADTAQRLARAESRLSAWTDERAYISQTLEGIKASAADKDAADADAETPADADAANEDAADADTNA